MKTVTISTAEARNNLSKVLAEAYYSGTTFLITKNRKIMAEIRKPIGENFETEIRKFAGTLSEKDANTIQEVIMSNRKLPTRSTKIKSV